MINNKLNSIDFAYRLSISAISLADFPRVSGTKKNPNRAFSKQITPKAIMQLERPNDVRQVGNMIPTENNPIHVIETTRETHVDRI